MEIYRVYNVMLTTIMLNYLCSRSIVKANGKFRSAGRANETLCDELFRYGIPKKVTQFRTIGPSNGLLAANIVEQNSGHHLSEPEFHAESNNSSLIPQN